MCAYPSAFAGATSEELVQLDYSLFRGNDD
jgi:hypothetical protein